MQLQISFTDEYLGEEFNKTICFLKGDQLFLSNEIDIKHIGFFQETLPEFSEIVYFEHNKPICPNCGADMGDNGSRKVKPNKMEGIRKNNIDVQTVVKRK